MTQEARKRISALEQYTELGSGFNIAMKDLEIRGAGDLLGGEQSGFISDIGFDTYQKILNEAIEELKEKEFKDLYQEDVNKVFVKDITIDTDIPILFPDDYINNIKERLHLYTKLNRIKEEKDLAFIKLLTFSIIFNKIYLSKISLSFYEKWSLIFVFSFYLFFEIWFVIKLINSPKKKAFRQ